MSQPHADRPRANAASLFIIRMSLVAGVMMLGAVTWHLHSRRTEPFPTDTGTLTWMVLGAWAALTAAIVFLSRRYRQPAARDQQVTMAIIGWALGETAALVGGAHYFVTGDPRRYGLGFLIFVFTLALFPIPRDDEGPRLAR